MTNTAHTHVIHERTQQYRHGSGDADSEHHVENHSGREDDHGAHGHGKDAHKGGLRWLSFLNSAVFLRSAIVAVVIGSVLTLINQSRWVVGGDPLQLLPFILVFVTPFVVVAISQVVAARRAFIDAGRRGAPASPEGFIDTTVSHRIPARAVAIGLIVGSINAIIIVAGALLRSGDLAAASVPLLGQVYALPLLFGVMSQALSYMRAAHFVREHAGSLPPQEVIASFRRSRAPQIDR